MTSAADPKQPVAKSTRIPLSFLVHRNLAAFATIAMQTERSGRVLSSVNPGLHASILILMYRYSSDWPDHRLPGGNVHSLNEYQLALFISDDIVSMQAVSVLVKRVGPFDTFITTDVENSVANRLGVHLACFLYR